MSFKEIHEKTKKYLNELDKLSMTDEIFITNKDGSMSHIKSSNKHRMIGEVIFEKVDLLGNVLFRSDPEYNDVVMTGSTLVLEKLLGIRANLTISTLSQDMNIIPTPTPNISNLPNEQIIGFMVGYGGSGETVGDVNAVKYTDKTLSNLIPFRMTSTQLNSTDSVPYFMVGQVNSKYCYYGKKFDTTPQIYHLFTDGSEVPSNISTTGTTKGIRVFGEMVCSLSSTDIREYFNNLNGSISQCRINTMGLVSGYPIGSDYGGIRLATEINFRSRYLDDDESSLRITYRLYCL